MVELLIEASDNNNYELVKRLIEEILKQND